jgi:hypothetical protein
MKTEKKEERKTYRQTMKKTAVLKRDWIFVLCPTQQRQKDAQQPDVLYIKTAIFHSEFIEGESDCTASTDRKDRWGKHYECGLR